MQLIIISKYFTPDTSVDSISSGQLITELISIDPEIDIHVVTSDIYYKNKPSLKGIARETTPYKLHVVSSFYHGSNKLLTFLGMIIDGLKMVLTARRIKIKTVISLTNPPLISLWCALLLRRKKWLYWTFDLYPDALNASNILAERNILYKILEYGVYRSAPDYLITLGEKQKEYLYKKYKKKLPSIILPCGIFPPKLSSADTPDWYQSDRNYIGYVGNVGRAHSKEFILKVADSAYLLDNFSLILAIYGEHKVEIENAILAKKLSNIILVDAIERKHLPLIDIHLVSLLPSWTNISVPSKAVSAVCAGSVLCFFGSEGSDTWCMFQECSYHVKNFADIPIIFGSLSLDELNIKKRNANEIAKSLVAQEKQAFREIYEFCA